MNKKLENLVKELQSVAYLKGLASMLHWDQATYMPKGAIGARSMQFSLLGKIIHEMETSPSFEKNLGDLLDLETGRPLHADFHEKELAMLREIYKDWKISKALPLEFVEKMTRLESESTHAWEEARIKNSFAIFAPYLEKMIELQKQRAQYLAKIFPEQKTSYDVLLNLYEPGMSSELISPIFAELKEGTLKILKKIEESKKNKAPASLFEQKLKQNQLSFSLDKQWEFGLMILKDMGFDFSRGRQDRSTHPFSTNFHPTDVRVTTRLSPHDLFEGLGSTIHEGGHALYEMGMDEQWFGTPLAQAISMGIHESQSRLWENFIGKSWEFWEAYFPKLKEVFSEQLGEVPLQDFYRHLNEVQPGLVRVEADEVTYNLHIMVRFEMEKEMINGQVKTAELPELWNAKYKEYLGIVPESPLKGILQDIHWSGGAIGYFPSYSLGNLYSAEFFDQAQKEIPQLKEEVRRGHLQPLTAWLDQKIFKVGRSLTAEELLKKVTGHALSAGPFLRSMEEKYARIYNF